MLGVVESVNARRGRPRDVSAAMTTIARLQLLDLARSRSPEGRRAIAETISALFGEEDATLSERERTLMFDILHRIVADLEATVCETLSAKLADMPDAPRELIRFLANDRPEVAYPVLSRSRVLEDQDLIEVVRARAMEHQLAVARRYEVSEQVSAALAETRNENVIEALLRNTGAHISRRTMAFLVEESQRYDSYQKPLLHRRELEPALAKRMFLWVSAALRSHIIDRFGLDDETVDSLLEAAAYEQISEAAAPPGSTGVEALAEELAPHGEVDPQLLVRAIAQGEISLFVGMLAQALRLKPGLVRRFLFESGGHGLAVACRAAGLDRPTVFRILTLSRAAKPRPTDVRAETQRALGVFDAVSPEEALKAVARWRLDPDYAAAIAAIETADTGTLGPSH
ncbi:MAG: DUF2336 domain-containing protein [Rhodospirillales bacterium]|nr:MAG: DUF2336 domain-containing protein [Rhodospirillales bacterium]